MTSEHSVMTPPMSRKRCETWGTPASTVFPMKKSTTVLGDSARLAREAKSLVALAFRNGPIEDLHAGKTCPICYGQAGYSHITEGEMRQVMKNAVDHVYTFLVLKEHDPKEYQALLNFGKRYTSAWDEPVLIKQL